MREYRSEIELLARALASRGVLTGAQIDDVLRYTAFGRAILTRSQSNALYYSHDRMMPLQAAPPKPALEQTIVRRGSRLLGTVVKLPDARYAAFEADGLQLGVFNTRAGAVDACDENAY